jgi:uncharacterized protein YjgD (DUF1641 family)
MGGGSSSLTKNNVTTRNIVEAMSKTLQNCQGNTVISQKVEIIGNYNVVRNVRLVQGMKLSSSCSLDDKNVAETQQSVANAIKQASESQNTAVLGALGSSSSKDETTILNEVKTKIDRETIQNIVNNFNATQDFFLRGDSNIVDDITMEQSMEVLYNNCLSALSKLSSFQEATQDISQTSKATQSNPISEIIDSIGSIFTSLGLMWVIIIVVALVVGGWILINGGPIGLIFGDDGDGISTSKGVHGPARPPMYPKMQQMTQRLPQMYPQPRTAPIPPQMYPQQTQQKIQLPQRTQRGVPVPQIGLVSA